MAEEYPAYVKLYIRFFFSKLFVEGLASHWMCDVETALWREQGMQPCCKGLADDITGIVSLVSCLKEKAK